MGSTASGPAPSFTGRFTPSARQGLVDALCDRFYVNEQGILISNGEFVYFPSDLAPHRADYLQQKIHNVISYTAAFQDIEEINALRHLPPDIPADFSPTLGLYLYFADECSRLHPETTFFNELRKAGITLRKEEKYDRHDLYAKVMDMLESLGMAQSHGKILKDWYEKGSYEIQGDSHVFDAQGVVEGAYTRLARDIDSLRTALPLNLSISYALGNKENMESIQRANASTAAEDAYAYTKSLTGPYTPEHIDPRILACIEKGDEIRKQRIREILAQRQKEEKEKEPPHTPATQSLARAILSKLPDTALELFYREGYNFAYSDDVDIRKCYPAELLPSTAQKDSQELLALGERQVHYRILFFSNGVDQNTEGFAARKESKLAQTVMHEMMHIAIGYLSEEQKEELSRKVEAVAAELKQATLPDYFHTKLNTLSRYRFLDETLRDIALKDVLDYNAFPYESYSDKNKREEVVCNLAGLMYSEYPYPAPKEGNNPYHLKSVDALARQINEALKVACAASRESFPHIQLPTSARSASAAR